METDLNGENSEIVTKGSSEAPQEIQQQQQGQVSSGPNWIEGEEIINLKRRKCALKSRLTRLRHEIEKLYILDSVEVTEVEWKIEQLWQDLEETHKVLDNMSRYYVSVGQAEKHLYYNYSKTRNLIGQYPCRMRQSCTRNLKVDVASHFTSLL